METPIEFRSVSDLLSAVGEAAAQYKARIATLEALLAERPAAPDPALLAPAKLGARLCRDQLSPTGGFCHARYEHLDRIGIEEGALIPGCLDSTGPVPKPGIADAIAALLAPDGAGESEVRS